MKMKFHLVLVLMLSLEIAGCQRHVPNAVQSRPEDQVAAIRLNNLGVAEMNRGRTGEAYEHFQQAWQRDASLFPARLNEGIALLNNQRFDEAREVLLDATQRQPDSARAWYNLGILYRNTAQVDAAIEAFERTTRIDPGDADALYFMGQLNAQIMRYDQAIAWYERCLALDGFHVSAEFGLARVYQLSGNDDAARKHLDRFDQLTQSKLGKPISLTYGEQGPYSTAEPVAGAATAPAEFAVRFSSATEQSGLRFEPHTQPGSPDHVLPLLGAGACFIDFDKDGRSDVLLLGGMRSVVLYRNEGGGKFTDVSDRAGFNVAGVTGETLGCSVGDYDNDGFDDIVVGFQDRVALYRNQGNGTFQDVTTAAGIHVDGLPLGLLLVDYDHDGDLDLYVSRFSNFAIPASGNFDFPFGQARTSNQLWRNNGNGTFTEWTAQSGLAADAPGIAAIASDFNNDRAIDLLLTGWRTAPALLTNPREGTFRQSEPWKSAFPAPASGVVAFDFNQDGWMDLAFTHWGQPGLTLWKNLGGTGFERVAMPDLQWNRGWGIAAVDVDNDGLLDLVAVGESNGRGEIRLLRNMGGERFSDVTQAAGLASIGLVKPRAVLTGDFDGDGDTDILVTQNGGKPVLLRNDGGNKRTSLRLAFQGLSDNKSAIGAKVEVFAGSLRQKWEVSSSSGYLGQNAPEIVVGMDSAREADIVRVLWPSGVPQDEVQLAAAGRHLIKEIDRRGSSCPLLFVWNGSRYEFISDIIGPGILGEWVSPSERNISDPTEYLKVDGNLVKPKNGRLSFKFAEAMEEITYLDHVRLLAIDHPTDVVVHPNEYFASQPPFPEFKVVVSRNARPPLAAHDDHGRNVLPELLSRDRRYVAGFDSLPFHGFTKMHYLELDLGKFETGDPLRLVMHGFTDYFTTTGVFAAHQADVHAVAPFLEAQTAEQAKEGKWTRVVDDIGFPAGLARTMIADLSGRLPAGTSRIRIGTNLKIYWDQILIDTTPQTAPFEIHDVPAVEARLAFRGYPKRVEGSVRGDASYIHEDVSPTGPFSRHEGHYTAYGDVLSLLRKSDDQFVIIGSGDEVSLEFDPSALPALRPGWSRDYFFYADGFAKEMDFYEAIPDSVEPLPFHAMGQYPYGPDKRYPNDAAYLAYRLGTNTRYVSGKDTPSFRYRYERGN
jgi:Tfp pilus assembly protein PilF